MERNKRHAYELPEGTVFVIVKDAKDQNKGRYGVPVPSYVGRLEVTTNPTDGYDDPKGFVTIRGYKYSMINGHVLSSVSGRDGQAIGWTYDGESYSQYSSGYRRENGTQVDYKSKAKGRLREIEDEALALFVKENPNWERHSVHLAHVVEWEAARGEVEHLVGQLRKAEAVEQKLRERMNGK